MRDLQTNQMRFIRQAKLESEQKTGGSGLQEEVNEVTCMAQSSDKNYLALGMVKVNDKRAYLVVQQIKNLGIKTKVMIKIDLFADQAEPTSQRYVTSITFLHDEKYLAVALNGCPDASVQIYRWSVSSSTGHSFKILAERDFPKQEISRLSIHPVDKALLTTSGNGLLRHWRIDEQTRTIVPHDIEIQGLPKPMSEYHFSDHCWTEEKQLVACTRQGDIFVVAIGNVIQHLRANVPASTELANGSTTTHASTV
jgi:WD40 repeat protein